MPAGNPREAYDGLANLSHGIRRSMALYVAMNMTTPEEGMDVLFDNADRCASWIKGTAEDRAAGDGGPEPLGQSFRDVTAPEG